MNDFVRYCEEQEQFERELGRVAKGSDPLHASSEASPSESDFEAVFRHVAGSQHGSQPAVGAEASMPLGRALLEFTVHVCALFGMIGLSAVIGWLLGVYATKWVAVSLATFFGLSATGWLRLQGTFLDHRWKEPSARPFRKGVIISILLGVLAVIPCLVAGYVWKMKLDADSPLVLATGGMLLLSILGIGISILLAGFACCWNDICTRVAPKLEYVGQTSTVNPLEVEERYLVVACCRSAEPLRYHWTIIKTLLMTVLLASIFLVPPIAIAIVYVLRN